MEAFIKRLREDKGYTQQDISNFVGVSVRQYQRYECGTAPPVNKAIKLARLFIMPVEQLFSETVN